MIAQNDRSKLHAREDAKQRVRIRGLHEEVVHSIEQLMTTIDHGNATRTTGATGIVPVYMKLIVTNRYYWNLGANADSSRSHAILQIRLRHDAESYFDEGYTDPIMNAFSPPHAS